MTAQEEGRSAPDLLTQVPGVQWERQFDHSVRTVRLELAGVSPMVEQRNDWTNEKRPFLPQWVEVVFDNGVRRSVSVRGANILKNGDTGLRSVESHYSFAKYDEHMPEWLKRLVAEVSES